MIFGTVYVIFKRLISLISAIMLLVVGADEKNLPSPDGAEIVAKNTYVLFDYQVTSQGVTNDGEYFYFSASMIANRFIPLLPLFCEIDCFIASSYNAFCKEVDQANNELLPLLKELYKENGIKIEVILFHFLIKQLSLLLFCHLIEILNS